MRLLVRWLGYAASAAGVLMRLHATGKRLLLATLPRAQQAAPALADGAAAAPPWKPGRELG